MPFKSTAQRRKFYADPKLHKYIPEFEADTPAHLPTRLHVPKRHSTDSTDSTQEDKMARLSAADRRKLPKQDYAVPSKKPSSGSYPVPDKAHAKAALSMVSRFGSTEEKKKVRAKVASKFGMGKSTGAGKSSTADSDDDGD